MAHSPRSVLLGGTWRAPITQQLSTFDTMDYSVVLGGVDELSDSMRLGGQHREWRLASVI